MMSDTTREKFNIKIYRGTRINKEIIKFVGNLVAQGKIFVGIIVQKSDLRLIDPKIGIYHNSSKRFKLAATIKDNKSDKLCIPYDEKYNSDIVVLLNKHRNSKAFIEKIDNGVKRYPGVYSTPYIDEDIKCYEEDAKRPKHLQSEDTGQYHEYLKRESSEPLHMQVSNSSMHQHRPRYGSQPKRVIVM
ncbi:MAG: hypothetical protein GY870_01690, partial [archaeon]|nr:hypothetical protein [archaeon]